MKKILALVLTLAMMLTMLNIGFVASAEDEIPAGATEITTAEQLAAMQADQVYYLGNDIVIGSEDAEAAIITIPAGVTLYGNGHAILMGFYAAEPDDYTNSSGQTGPGTNSKDWTHAIFQLSAGNAITFNGVSFGTLENPVYLDTKAGTGPNAYSAWGLFLDVTGSNVVWNDCDFYFDRQNGGLDSVNLGPVCYQILGNFQLNNCTRDGYVSAGSQHGGWFYTSGGSAVLTMDGCVATGTLAGSYTGGIIHSPAGGVDLTITNYTNYANLNLYYGSGTGGFWSTMVGNFGGGANGELYMENCVNYGNVSMNAPLTIGGTILGRTASAAKSIQIIGCVNYGNVSKSGAHTTSNHGNGMMIGHTGAIETYNVIDCVNYGNYSGAGSNAGGIIGLKEGSAPLLIDGCVNFGNISSVAETNETAGIIGQWRTGGVIKNTKNYGTITSSKAKAYIGGIVGRQYTGDASYSIENCSNYGAIGTKNSERAAGILGHYATGVVNLDGCVNYGKITTYQYSGGMIAEALNTAATINITNCVNRGEVAGVHGVGGFIGHTNNSENIKIYISNSLNAGYIHEGPAAGEGIGGFLGRIAGFKTIIELTNCVNIGTVQGSTKNHNMYGAFGDTFGQFLGTYTVNLGNNYNTEHPYAGGFYNWDADGATKPVLTNCYAYGTALVSDGAMSLTGWITKDEATDTNYAQADCIKSEIPVTEAPNGGAYGINVAVDEDSTIYYLANTTIEDAVETLLDLDWGVMAGAADEDKIVFANPEIRGYQQSLDGTSIRILATVPSSNYNEVGFIYSVTVNGVEKAKNVEVSCSYVMKTINAAGSDGSITSYSAEQLFGKYITAITFNNVPTEGEVEITVLPTADNYLSYGYTITIIDGEVADVEVAKA